jgi:PAS domain S-box-containing protein
MKILAVDDNRDNLTVLQAVVRDALPGVEILTALNGQQALAAARSADPDVVLLDIVMPGMDGFAVCRELKTDARLREIPVLFLTALRTDRESRIKALEAGAEGFLSKPFDEAELIAQIRAMAKIKQANCQHRLAEEQLAQRVADRTRELEQELAERQRTEQALRRREESYHSFVSNSREAIYCTEFDHPIDTSLPTEQQIDAIYENGYLGECNQAMATMYGIPSVQAFLGIRLIAVHGGKDVPANRSTFRRFIESSYRTVDSETAEITPQGERRYFLSSDVGTVQDGRLLRIWGVATDITARRLAEQALRESETTARALINATRDAAYLLDTAGTTLDLNDEGAHRLGLRKADLLGRCMFDFLPPQVAAARRARLAEVARGGQPLRFEDERSGRIIDSCVQPLLDEQGRVTRFAVFARDITAARQAETTLREQMAELRRWYQITLGREGRVLELKKEVNALLTQAGKALRYALEEGV